MDKQIAISRWNAELYDRDETGTEDIAFLLPLIGDAPKRVLEIACGSGRILYPLAVAGHHVLGYDFDEEMLSRIPLRGSALPNLRVQKRDVIGEDWDGEQDVVLLAANFLFNIVSELDYRDAQELLIQKASRALRPGGHLFIDYGYTLHPEEWFFSPGERLIWEGRDSAGTYGKMLLKDSRYDAKTGLSLSTRRYEMTFADGSTFTQELPVIKHFPLLSDVHAWLTRWGFIVEQECGDYAGNPIGETTHRAILWAKKA